MSILIVTYLQKKLRKIKLTICNYWVDSPFYLWPYIRFVDLQEKSMAIYITLNKLTKTKYH